MIFNAKTQPAPPCLAVERAKANGNYNCDGVLSQNKGDFRNKCYVCEDKEPHSINTEHFIPHRGDQDLKFDWNNLFYCCSHCNSTKGDKRKFDSILNCTVQADGVDTRIKYHIDPWPKEKAEIAGLADDTRVSNTVDLLREVYNGTTELKQIESANLRSKLLREIREFQNLLVEFYEDGYTPDEREPIRAKIIRHLRPTSNFTAFKKWIIRDNEVMSVDFAEFI